MRRMTPSHPASRGRSLSSFVAAASMLVMAAPGAAAPGALLEISFGPSQTEWLAVDALNVRLDGQELPVRRPAGEDPVGTALYSGPIASGPHLVEMTVVLRGASGLFTYVDGYLFTMRGRIAVTAPVGNVVGVHGRVQASSGATTAWTDRYTLALAAAPYPSDRAVPVESPEPAPPPPAPPAASPPAPSVTPQPPAAAACALAPVHFGFDQSTLSPAARQALDRFAACLDPGASTIRLDGHCDVRGGVAYNLALGGRRAAAVARYLESRGVAAGRISTSSSGKSSPVCGEATEACHARNRRVEAVVGG